MFPLRVPSVTMETQDQTDLIRLMAKLQAIEAQDAQKALTCRELLKKLSRHVNAGDSAATDTLRRGGAGPTRFHGPESWWASSSFLR